MATVTLSGDLKQLAETLLARGGRLRPATAAGAAAMKRSIEDYYRGKPGKGFFKASVAGSKVAITELQETHAVVMIDSYELAHRIKGGTVRPIAPRRALAIPRTDEARAAGYPSNNRIPGVFHPKGTRVLAVKNPGSDSFRALWALVPSVTHRPHPEDDVPLGIIRTAAEPAMRDAILRALRGRQ
jgi:hypothetical protein